MHSMMQHFYCQSLCFAELTWLSQKEDEEVQRDWADPSLNLQRVESYYENLMSELERRESQFSSVVDDGEALLMARHPASKIIEAHLSKMKAKWAWVLELTLCLETHHRYDARKSEAFFDFLRLDWVNLIFADMCQHPDSSSKSAK